MQRKMKRITSIMMMLLFVATLVAGCGQGSNGGSQNSTDQGKTTGTASQNESGEKELTPLEYSFYYSPSTQAASLVPNNPNDVVTPYVEEKFKIKVKDIITAPNQSFTEVLNQWIAADNIPDVMMVGGEAVQTAVETGKFADLTDYVKEMKNYNKYFSEDDWNLYTIDNKIYQIPAISLNLNSPEYISDPYYMGLKGWAIWVREDLLLKAGYKLTTISEIQKQADSTGIKPTIEDYAISPAINTPDDFYELLKKLNELNLSVGDKPLIPMSISAWQQWHFGSMFDIGHWRIDENGNVDGYLGSPDAKEYYKFLNKLFNEDLIDKDFLIQKDEQLQEKIASGRVACGLYIPDLNAAKESMAKINPEARIRYIPWPKKTEGKGFYDLYVPGYWRFIIKKDFSDIERLVQYFDWFYSDEGLNTITWGPESAGLWETKDGKQVFKKEYEADMLSLEHGKKGPDYFGLYDASYQWKFWSKAALCVPAMYQGNPMDFHRSYTPQIDAFTLNQRYSGANSLNTDGTVTYSDKSPNTVATDTYYWEEFQANKAAKLIAARNDSAYDAAWDEVYKEFQSKGKYEDAKVDIKKWFAEHKK